MDLCRFFSVIYLNYLLTQLDNVILLSLHYFHVVGNVHFCTNALKNKMHAYVVAEENVSVSGK